MNVTKSLDERLFAADGGLETYLIFKRGFDLPAFASYPMLTEPLGRVALLDYYRSFAEVAAKWNLGFILSTPTWRAQKDWGTAAGLDPHQLDQINKDGVALMRQIREEFLERIPEILISGCVGPRGDGYVPDTHMDAGEAQAYHTAQIASFAEAGVDLVGGMTLNYSAEAVGIARAGADLNVPVMIAFTVETDGRLPGGNSIGETIEEVDAACDHPPVCYLINCAHPVHVLRALEPGQPWMDRIRGVRANASRCSHAELNNSTVLDEGDPEELGRLFLEIREKLPRLSIVGGCCGTDARHVAAICRNLTNE